jgi:hypothetical protein
MCLGHLEVCLVPELEVMGGWVWGQRPTTPWKNWRRTSGLLLPPAHLTGRNRFLFRLGTSSHGPSTVVVFFFFFVEALAYTPFFCLAVDVCTGLLPTMPPTPMAMSHGKGSISRTEGFATSMGFPTSIPPLWAKPLDFVFLQSRPGAWAFGGTVNITVSSTLFPPCP